jgi:glycerophosphoryl diester phosphodiesterase
MKTHAIIGAALCAAALATATDAALGNGGKMSPSGSAVDMPLIIGHRGISGHLPEHTLESYALAIDMGADYIEPDLVATRDGVLIARHEPMLGATTDVSSRPEFASRRSTKVLDGISTTDWFASDFTLAEIKTLRAIQPAGERDRSFDGRFEIPTFEEVIALAKRKSAEAGRTIGVYPETKHPTFHEALGLPLEDRILDVLTRAGWNHANAPVFIQSFEVGNLRYLRSRTRVKLVQLIDGDDVGADGQVTLAPPYDKPYDFAARGDPRTFKDLLTPAGLREIASYADGIGPWKPYLIGAKCIADKDNDGKCDDANGDGLVNDADRTLILPSSVVADAKAAGLLVHPFTFRNEQRRLASDFKGNPVNEYVRFFDLGVDGLFTDFSETARVARSLYLLKKHPRLAACLKRQPGNASDPLCRASGPGTDR